MACDGHRAARVIGLVCWSAAAITASGCQWRMPTAPTPTAGISIPTLFPPSGSPILIGPPGFFIVRHSGQVWVQVLVRTNGELALARLNVYLQNANGTSCGQNLPDWPMWTPFPAGVTMNLLISGFQIWRLPCDVTGIRAALHIRSELNLNTELLPHEIILDTTVPVSYHLSR